MRKGNKVNFVFSFIKYQLPLLSFSIAIVLWSAILLQLLASETPCPRCWEVRWVYLVILQLISIMLVTGYRELLSIVIIALFILLGDVITVQQLITHTIHLTENAAFHTGYGAYAVFLGLSLPVWNVAIANLAIIYICFMNYFKHQFRVEPYQTTSMPSKVLVVLWGLAPLLTNIYLYIQHLKDIHQLQ